MSVSPVAPHAVRAEWFEPAAPKPPPPAGPADDAEVREAFRDFVGQALFGEMLRAMRKTVGRPAYFHGGRAEEIFQQQLDQVFAERVAETGARRFTEPMYELFAMKRR